MSSQWGKIVVSYTSADGLGRFESDPENEFQDLPGGATIRRIASLEKVPVQSVNIGGQNLSKAVSNPGGVTVLECQIGPGELTPLHATPSIDFGIMVAGEIWLILDSGDERLLRTGDIYIQKAAVHAWENRSKDPARFCTVLVAASGEESS